MKYKRLIIAVSVLAVIFGGIAISKSLGWWQTSGSRKIIQTSGNGAGGPGSGHEDSGDGIEEEHATNEVTGSTTVGRALEMGIPEAVLAEYVGDTSDKDALVKDLIIANGLSFGKTKSILNGYIVNE
jgi:hypothetical protein